MVTISYTAQPAPAVSTGSASAINATGATVHGTVNPEGLATTYELQYGSTTAYGSSTPSASAGSGSSDVAVSAAIAGLAPHTTYHYRLVATNASGTTDGADETFTTLAAPPTVVTGAASNVTRTAATLHGTVTANGAATTYSFQYGTSTAYGHHIGSLGAGSGTTTQSVSGSISGLTPGTTYHYRIVAVNAEGTSEGADHTFTTPASPLKLTVSPTRVHAGTHACFAFRTTSTGHPVAGVTIHLVGHTARTSHAGTAGICVTLGRGTHHPSATKHSYHTSHATITATTAPAPKPNFTG